MPSRHRRTAPALHLINSYPSDWRALINFPIKILMARAPLSSCSRRPCLSAGRILFASNTPQPRFGCSLVYLSCTLVRGRSSGAEPWFEKKNIATTCSVDSIGWSLPNGDVRRVHHQSWRPFLRSCNLQMIPHLLSSCNPFFGSVQCKLRRQLTSDIDFIWVHSFISYWSLPPGTTFSQRH